MTSSSYKILEALLASYTEIPGNSPNVEQLRKCLQSVSAEDIYRLLAARNVWTGVTAIYTAVQRDQAEVLSCFLDFITKKQRNKLLLTTNRNGASFLHFAAYFGSNEAARRICVYVSQEFRFQLFSKQANSGQTALHWAAWKGHTELITHILDSVEPAQQIQLLDITDNSDRTVLDVALQYSNQSTADLIEQYRSKAYYQIAAEGEI